MVTVGYSSLNHVTELLQWVTARYRVVKGGYGRLPSGYSGLQLVTAIYSRLPSGCSGLQQVTAGYRVVTVGYSRLPSGYSGL